ncbi:MAG: bifunctional sulfate adenylyltransferase/adenylylsulfate kinase [Desulfobacterales bacterium]|nr:bifunctional sulfate adenylyltransferase/adenylylsulfate kinase [Desulfobacterales bacterium]
MTSVERIEPHGGKLNNLICTTEKISELKKVALELVDIALNERQQCDLELLATGVFSPLDGFMTQKNYNTVIEDMRLSNGILWPVPICLDISSTIAEKLEIGRRVGLRDQEGFLLAIMTIEDKWKVDKKREAEKLYGTTDTHHPGVFYLFHQLGDYYIGGKIDVLSVPLHFDFKRFRQTPEDIRKTYKKMGWKRVVGFQTRNPIHRPQFELTIKAMQQAKANLLLLPNTGMAKPGDFDHYTRVRCYREVTRHYPPDSFILNLLPLSMRMAGPREALLHAIIAKNFGCTHFIIGNDHASPGTDQHGKRFYGTYDAHNLAEKFSEELALEIITFDEIVYLPFEDEHRPKNAVPPGTQTISLTGSDIRKRIKAGKNVPEWATFPEVVRELRKGYPAPDGQGFTIFCTGLSGAGKSTVAKVLYSRFLELGDRPVTLLDGDIVRQNLSSELNFSKEHRDINVLRIGFVASEITKNRGIAICAPIAPYERTRSEVRDTIEAYGGFIEVHVATSIEECEKRDRKGMYAKARAGQIKGFTGIDDPYEIPENPEIRIDTTEMSPDEAAQEILLYLGQKGYI